MTGFGHLASKTKSLGQIKEIPCGCSRGHISRSIDLKTGQIVCLNETRMSVSLGYLGS